MLSEKEIEIVKFGKSNGKSDEQIMQALSKYRIEQTAVIEQPEQQNNGILQQAKDVGIGFVKGIGSTIKGIADIGRPFQAAIDPTRTLADLKANAEQQPYFNDEALKATNKAQMVGKGIEFAGEVLTPLGATKAGRKAVGAVLDTAGTKAGAVVETAGKAKATVVNTIDDIGSRVTSPSVSNATRVSLNPKEALKGTGQDMTVSVGGKLKKLSELTPDENTRLQFSTQKTVNKFTDQAKLFKNNRNPANDPTEIVGKRVDAALDFADRKRQVVGRKMGEIETKYASESLPISEPTLNKFAETLKSIDNPKFGVDTADAPIVQKLVKDFDLLEKSGASIADRMDFVRSWDKYLNDAKDGFGNFKANATVNTRIQGAIKTLKDETVDAIAAKDKTYRNLRTQYSTYKQLDEIGNTLLGKDGALGSRVKGGATVKRALKSNSDAGARQFLTKLKELTGYDAIKDGDLALTAMENVGDFQGLSLLEVLKDGKSGAISSSLEFIQNKVVGDEATRVNKFIKKGT